MLIIKYSGLKRTLACSACLHRLWVNINKSKRKFDRKTGIMRIVSNLRIAKSTVRIGRQRMALKAHPP